MRVSSVLERSAVGIAIFWDPGWNSENPPKLQPLSSIFDRGYFCECLNRMLQLTQSWWAGWFKEFSCFVVKWGALFLYKYQYSRWVTGFPPQKNHPTYSNFMSLSILATRQLCQTALFGWQTILWSRRNAHRFKVGKHERWEDGSRGHDWKRTMRLH